MLQKRENALEDVSLVMGTQQNLSNLYSLDIYASDSFNKNCITTPWDLYYKHNLAMTAIDI